MLDDGYRLPCPESCPSALHELMLTCWSAQPCNRSCFSDIYLTLDRFICVPQLLQPPSPPVTLQPDYVTPQHSSTNSLQHLLAMEDHGHFQEIPTLDQWLTTMQLGGYGRYFYEQGINDLQALSSLSKSDIARMEILSGEHMNRLESGLDTLRRAGRLSPSSECTIPYHVPTRASLLHDNSPQNVVNV